MGLVLRQPTRQVRSKPKAAHLFSWAGASATDHLRLGKVTIGQQEIPVVSANVWLPRNKAGERDSFSKRPAVCLELAEGIAVCPPQALHPVSPGFIGNHRQSVVEARLDVDRLVVDHHTQVVGRRLVGDDQGAGTRLRRRSA